MAKVVRKLPSEVWKYFDKRDNGKMKCKLCSWECIANATRMSRHWETHNAKEEEDQPTEVSQTSTPSLKRAKIEDHLDRNFTAAENQRAQKRLAFAAIMNGWSHHSLQGQAFQDFCKAMRWLWK